MKLTNKKERKTMKNYGKITFEKAKQETFG